MTVASLALFPKDRARVFVCVFCVPSLPSLLPAARVCVRGRAWAWACVCVGDPLHTYVGCGKSTMLAVLHRALGKMGGGGGKGGGKKAPQIVRHIMNPKALEREKLLG